MIFFNISIMNTNYYLSYDMIWYVKWAIVNEGQNTRMLSYVLKLYVIFSPRLSFIEKKNCFINRSQMISTLKCHYVKQALKQILVIVFGVDVLGNPLGFLRGMADGIEDLFYEPFQVYNLMQIGVHWLGK